MSRWIWIVALLALGGCGFDSQPRPLTAAEVKSHAMTKEATLLKAETFGEHSIVFMQTCDEKTCHMIQMRYGNPFGLYAHAWLGGWPPGPVAVLEGNRFINDKEHLILCIAIDDPQLQATMAGLRITLQDGASSLVTTGGEHVLIIPVATRTFPVHYKQVELLDAAGRVLHTKVAT